MQIFQSCGTFPLVWNSPITNPKLAFWILCPTRCSFYRYSSIMTQWLSWIYFIILLGQRSWSTRAFELKPKRHNFHGIHTQIAIAALIASATPAHAGNIDQGQKLFDDNCASCHMGGANYAKPERTLQQDALVKYGIGVEQPSIMSFVTNSQKHKNLVFFRAEGGKLNPQQWEDVTTFISDQAKGDKW